MAGFTFGVDDSYAGEGLSLGLARGLLCSYEGQNITQEGLGIGVVALKHGGFTCFASASHTERRAANCLARSYVVDKRLLWCWRGRPSVALTRLSEYSADRYMGWPTLQNGMLALVTRLRRTARVTPLFAKTAPLAQADFIYSWERGRIEVECQLYPLQDGVSKAFVMNELGADFFRASWQGGQIAPPPSGWQRLPDHMPTPALYDAERGLRFALSEMAVAQGAPVRLFWGRERNADCCWAGFELEFERTALAAAPLSCRYVIELRHQEDPWTAP